MLISFIRSIILYLVLVGSIRLMGKRQMGELEPAELVVALLIADLASVPMQDTSIPLLWGVIPIVTVLAIELLSSAFSLRFLRFRKFLCGNPIVLIDEGKINQKNLKRTRITIDELLQHMRQNNVLDLSIVQYAVLETDGQISVFVYPKFEPATAIDAQVMVDEVEMSQTVISDGKIIQMALDSLHKDRIWLEKQLKEMGKKAEEIFLLTATPKGKIYVSFQEAKS